jgi:hypothetical protein
MGDLGAVIKPPGELFRRRRWYRFALFEIESALAGGHLLIC